MCGARASTGSAAIWDRSFLLAAGPPPPAARLPACMAAPWRRVVVAVSHACKAMTIERRKLGRLDRALNKFEVLLRLLAGDAIARVTQLLAVSGADIGRALLDQVEVIEPSLM